jgi:hypothetical protein
VFVDPGVLRRKPLSAFPERNGSTSMQERGIWPGWQTAYASDVPFALKLLSWFVVSLAVMLAWLWWARRPASRLWHVGAFGLSVAFVSSLICLLPHVTLAKCALFILIDAPGTSLLFLWGARPVATRKPLGPGPPGPS